MTAADRLSASLWEADRHAAALAEALADGSPRSGRGLEEIESDRRLVRLLDQLLFRFTKLQDAMGERLVPTTLTRLAEPHEDRPVRDRLNRLEKLGFLDVGDRLRWREVRHRLAHEYPAAPALRLAAPTAGIAAAAELQQAYAAWWQRLVAST